MKCDECGTEMRESGFERDDAKGLVRIKYSCKCKNMAWGPWRPDMGLVTPAQSGDDE